MHLKQRKGKQVKGRRTIEVELPVDDIYVVYEGKEIRVAWAERKPGAPLVPLAELTESETARAKKLLAGRDCEKVEGKRGEEKRNVHPVPHVSDED